MMSKIQEKGQVILLIILVITGAVLRFYHLDYNSFWFDESFTLFAAKHTLAGIWDIVSNNSKELASVLLTAEFNPPLFHYIEHFMLVFGESEFVLRFIPALLGILTIPVFYVIGREFGDGHTGIIMAALLTFSPFHIFYSQDARAYSTMLFFFSLAFLFVLRAERTNRVHAWVLFGFFSALTFWTHYYALIPLVLLFGYVFFQGISRGWKDIHHLRPFAISSGTFLILCLPLIPLLLGLYAKRTSTSPQWGTKGLDLAYQIFVSLSGYNRYVTVIFFVLFLTGIFFFWKTDRAKTMLMVGLLAVPIIVSVYLSERMPMTVRYLIFLFPVFFLGISLSLKPVAGLFRSKNSAIILMVLFFLFQAPFLAAYYVPYYTQNFKEDWRGMAMTIQENTTPGDYIIVVPYYTRLPLDIYYNNSTQGTFECGVRNESEIMPILSGLHNTTAYFVVTGHIAAADPDGSTMRWLQNNTQRIGTTKSIELYRLALA